MDPGEAFLTGLITGQHDETGTDQNDDDGDNDPVDKDASLFSSTSLGDLEGSNIYGNSGARPDDVSDTTATNKHSENEPVRSDLPILLDRFAQLPVGQFSTFPRLRDIIDHFPASPTSTIIPDYHHNPSRWICAKNLAPISSRASTRSWGRSKPRRRQERPSR